MKKKKPLTIKQKITKQRAIKWTTYSAEYVSVFTPFAIMAGVYWEDWVQLNPSGPKVALGGFLALALLGIAMALVTKKTENEKLTNGMIALTLGWFAVAFIFFLLGSIIEQIANIMLFGGIGLAGACGLNVASNRADLRMKKLINAQDKAEEELLKEQAKKEQAEHQATE